MGLGELPTCNPLVQPWAPPLTYCSANAPVSSPCLSHSLARTTSHHWPLPLWSDMTPDIHCNRSSSISVEEPLRCFSLYNSFGCEVFSRFNPSHNELFGCFPKTHVTQRPPPSALTYNSGAIRCYNEGNQYLWTFIYYQHLSKWKTDWKKECLWPSYF